MMWKSLVATMLLALAGATFAMGPDAAAPVYRPVNSAELLGGYIPDGEWIETSGHVWFTDAGIFFNFNRVSARYPMRVDIGHADPIEVHRLRSECSSPGQFEGGCWMVIRGQTGKVGDRRGIFAREMRIAPEK
jgi:hypothetical protein